jgi:hypothetical protein
MSAQHTDVLERRPSVRHQPRKTTTQPREDLENLFNLEFSDYGRDPRFVSGWWMLPGLCLSAALIVWAASMIL